VGDGLHLSIAGGFPNSSVTYTLNLNGQGTSSPISAGSTDSTGAYELSATIPSNPGDAGTNVEVWYVAGVAAAPTLSFSVYVGCPSLAPTGSIQKPYWNPTYWSYSGSLSIGDFSAAFGSWNSAQSIVPFTEDTTGGYLTDFFFSDASLSSGVLGQATEYGFNAAQSGYPSSCYLHESTNCSALCFVDTKLWYANISLDPTQIGSNPNMRNVHYMTEAVVAHEVGHVLGIHDYDGNVDCASGDTTIMSAEEVIYCGTTGPQGCDTTYEASLYSGWTVWPFSSCGPYCNTATNCN
jgi:hypothetical protein